MHPHFNSATPRDREKGHGSMRNVGVARALSKLGFCSRKQAAQLVLAGRVKVNGQVRREQESPVQIDQDRIEVDGQCIKPSAKIYLMLNKPRGVVTTASDEQGRKTVYDFLPRSESWIAPVGRLDKASEGLLLLTNDSEWAAGLLAPESHVTKTYHVQIGAIASETLLQSLRHGVHDAHKHLRATSATILRQGQRNSWLEIVLDEGRNRQIRRMFNAFGIEVLRLVRVAIGPLKLGDLAKGAARPLTRDERAELDRALGQHADQQSAELGGNLL